MIVKIPYRIDPLERDTTLHIYLPDDYERKDERYPVMYMYDGHNLFDDNDATYGKSWGWPTFWLDTTSRLSLSAWNAIISEGTA